MYYTPQWFKRYERWLGEQSTAVGHPVQHHETSHSAIQQFIEKPPGKLVIDEIYPPKPHSMALGSRIPALREDYKPGDGVRISPPLVNCSPQRRSLVPFVADCRAGTVVVPPAALNDTHVADVTAPQATTPHLPTRSGVSGALSIHTAI